MAKKIVSTRKTVGPITKQERADSTRLATNWNNLSEKERKFFRTREGFIQNETANNRSDLQRLRMFPEDFGWNKKALENRMKEVKKSKSKDMYDREEKSTFLKNEAKRKATIKAETKQIPKKKK